MAPPPPGSCARKENWLLLYKIIGKANLDIPRLGNRVIYRCANNVCLLNSANGADWGKWGGGREPDKKSKERREKDRKALRMRRINSLKRQISIKEKMLEVSALQLLIVYFCPP